MNLDSISSGDTLPGKDEGKWVRTEGWGNIDETKEKIMSSVAMYKDAPVKPNF